MADAAETAQSAAPRSRPGLPVSPDEAVEGLGGLVEQLVDRYAGQSGRDQPERAQCAVAAADVRIGEEHLVARVLSGLLQRRAGVGDDHDPLRGVEPGVAERLVEGAPVAVGLERPAALARHHDDGAVQPVGDGGGHLARVGRVEHGELDPVGRGDDLGCQRRPAHPGEDHVVDTVGAQRLP